MALGRRNDDGIGYVRKSRAEWGYRSSPPAPLRTHRFSNQSQLCNKNSRQKRYDHAPKHEREEFEIRNSRHGGIGKRVLPLKRLPSQGTQWYNERDPDDPRVLARRDERHRREYKGRLNNHWTSAQYVPPTLNQQEGKEAYHGTGLNTASRNSKQPYGKPPSESNLVAPDYSNEDDSNDAVSYGYNTWSEQQYDDNGQMVDYNPYRENNSLTPIEEPTTGNNLGVSKNPALEKELDRKKQQNKASSSSTPVRPMEMRFQQVHGDDEQEEDGEGSSLYETDTEEEQEDTTPPTNVAKNAKSEPSKTKEQRKQNKNDQDLQNWQNANLSEENEAAADERLDSPDSGLSLDESRKNHTKPGSADSDLAKLKALDDDLEAIGKGVDTKATPKKETKSKQTKKEDKGCVIL